MNVQQLRLRGKWPERVGWMLLAGTVFWAASGAWEYAALDKRHPIADDVPVRMSVLTEPPIIEGTDIQVRFTRNKIRDDCDVYSLRKAVDSRGRSIDLNSERWEGAPADGTHLNFSYATGTLPPDDYTLQITIDYLCPGDLKFTTVYPPADFTIYPADYVEPEVEQQMMIEELTEELETLKRQVDEVTQ